MGLQFRSWAACAGAKPIEPWFEDLREDNDKLRRARDDKLTVGSAPFSASASVMIRATPSDSASDRGWGTLTDAC